MAEDECVLDRIMHMVNSGDNRGLVQLMVGFREEWNSLMEENRRLKKELHLKNLDLRGMDLKGIDLSGVEIEDSDMSGSDLTGADLSGARITGVKFADATLYSVNLQSARISQSDFSRVHLYGSSTYNMHMTGSVNLFDAYMERHDPSIEETYRTHPEITKRGFRMLEAAEYEIEHPDEEDEDQGY
ncbi:MAG: pentapeptide repeat-containing protein [Nanoarchaeota archaeon]|nr:pentapeptide repeat-containing protein [Nanoarchaeota archaeon]